MHEHTPTLRTDTAEQMGLPIHIWSEWDSNMLDLNESRENYAMLTFAYIPVRIPAVNNSHSLFFSILMNTLYNCVLLFMISLFELWLVAI